MKKFIITLTMLVLLLLPLSACQSKKDDNTIRLNEVTHSVFYAPLYVALEKGYFDEQNIKVELSNGQGANNSMSQIISGNADIGLMGPEASIYVCNEGRQNYPIIFGQLTNCDGSFIMSRTKNENFKLSDMIGKEILGGRKGGVPAMSLERALKIGNVYDKVKFNSSVQFDMMVGAFVGGTGDYCTVFEPTASMLEKQGSAYVVSDVAKYSGKMPFTVFMCSKEYLNSHNGNITSFMKAIIKAMKYVNESPSIDIAKAIKRQFPSTDLSVLSSSINRYKQIGAYRVNPCMDRQDFERFQNMIIDCKIMDKKADFNKIVDNSIASSLIK